MEIVSTKSAPAAVGPYSQAVKSGGFVFCSGQIPLTAAGEILEGNIKEQTVQVMDNLKAVLREAGSDLSRIVKATIFLADINDFGDVNEVYARYFEGDFKPARACVEVSRLPKDVKLEIECVAEV